MNFFGSSGYLNIIEAKTKESNAEMTVSTKSLDSSEEDLENTAEGSPVISKYGSLSRQQMYNQRLKNRKNNSYFRSIWYDEEDSDEQIGVSSDSKEKSWYQAPIRKATSLDNLLVSNSDSGSKSFLTKNMISSPIWPRKIVGNWTDKRQIALTLCESLNTSDTASASQIYDQVELATVADEDYKEDIRKYSSALNINCEIEVASTTEYFPEKIEIDKLEKISSLNINTTKGTTNDGTLEKDNVEKGQSAGQQNNSNNNAIVGKFEATDTKLLDSGCSQFKSEYEPKDAPTLEKCLTSDNKNIEINMLKQDIFEYCLPKEETVNAELRNKDSSLEIIEQPGGIESINPQDPANNQDRIDMKKIPSLENLLKLNTLDNRSKRRNILKSDISPPTLPRKIQKNGGILPMDSVKSENGTNLLEMRSKSKSTTELLKSFNQIKNEKLEQSNDPKFPISESEEIDEDVQIRKRQNINQYRFSKTTDFDFGRKHQSNNKDFEIRACTKLLLPNESSPIKLKKKEVIKYQDGHFYRVDNNFKKILKANVSLKSARLLNKRDVELKDSNNLSYFLFFESSKDAKLFLDNEKVSCYVDNKSTITRTLLRLLGKRSSREVLEKKGIYQNEPIFGNTLRNIYSVENAVPEFILKTIELIERPENITSLGLYRTSGNLATIQKIRFEVDKGRLNILNEYCKDVDVLTGSLKLFFRELKEPLIPCDICDDLLHIGKSTKYFSKKDGERIISIIRKLPESNSETLYCIIKHLAEVVKYKNENKMDAYNMSVCWGPTITFITDSTPNASGRDIVAHSTDAARVFEALLTFYIENPEELEFIRKRQDYIGSNKTTIQRQDSKESIESYDSTNLKLQKKSTSNLSLNIDEILKKLIELIEVNISSEGLYKKSGSNEKISKLMKKMTKKKVHELEKYKFDTNELTDSLKKYLRDLSEPMVTKESMEQVIKLCDNNSCLEHGTRQKIISVIEELSKKDTLIYLVRHIIRVLDHELHHNVSKDDMISIWTNVLNYQKRITDSNEKFSVFLRILLDAFDETKPDIILPSKVISNGLLNDLKKYQKDKDRCSKYDNVPEIGVVESGISKETTIIEEKTEELEFTKL